MRIAERPQCRKCGFRHLPENPCPFGSEEKEAVSDHALAVLQNALKEIIEAAETVLNNAHWEVRYGSGDLTDAINHGKKVLSEHAPKSDSGSEYPQTPLGEDKEGVKEQ